MNRGRRWCRPTLLAMVAIVVLCLVARQSRAGEQAGVRKQFLLNGQFMTGSGDQPDDWRTEAWVESPSAVAYRWTPPVPGGQGMVEIENLQANDARWQQTIALAPGWYHFTAEIRTENVPTSHVGATISVMEDGIMSRDIHGTTEWTPVGFYLRVGPHGADIDVAMRLGGYGSLDTGRAFFRNASVVRMPGLPLGAFPAFDLEQIRRAMTPAPTGSPISLVATMLALLLLAGWGWRAFGREPPSVSRAEARRTRAKESRRR